MYSDHPLVEQRRRICQRSYPPDIKKLTKAIYFTGIMFTLTLLDLMINLVQFEQLCKLPL